MDAARKKRLEAKGWKTGSVQELLGLSDEDMAVIELKLQLSKAVVERRRKEELSQAELAKRMGSSQSRIAKLEAGDPTVSIDLLVRALVQLGLGPKDIGRLLLKTA